MPASSNYGLGVCVIAIKNCASSAQVGVGPNKTEPDLLSVVPITKKSKEKPVNDRRIWRWLSKFAKKAGWELQEESDFQGALRKGDLVLYVRCRR